MRPALSREPPGKSCLPHSAAPLHGVITGDPPHYQPAILPFPAASAVPSRGHLLLPPHILATSPAGAKDTGLRGVCVMPH